MTEIILQYAPIAQLDRASDYESEGRAFESLWVRFFPSKPISYKNLNLKIDLKTPELVFGRAILHWGVNLC